MNRDDVKAQLMRIREARRAWDLAYWQFKSDVDIAMMRLINEAAANRFSAEEVSTYSGFTVKRVRAIMRQNNLNPKQGRALISRKAASVLEENAILMGIEPRDMNLTSMLAYLPAGKDLRRGSAANGVSKVTEFPETAEEAYRRGYEDRAAERDFDPTGENLR